MRCQARVSTQKSLPSISAMQKNDGQPISNLNSWLPTEMECHEELYGDCHNCVEAVARSPRDTAIFFQIRCLRGFTSVPTYIGDWQWRVGKNRIEIPRRLALECDLVGQWPNGQWHKGNSRLLVVRFIVSIRSSLFRPVLGVIWKSQWATLTSGRAVDNA